MTLTVEDDFAGFVAARWPDLEAVALVATLDPVTARELTTRCLAALREGWGATASAGGPTAAARRDLLARAAELPAPELPDPETTTLAPAATPADPQAASPGDDAVERALLDALTRETPVVRAALGAQVLWQVTPDELTGLLGRAATTVGPAVAAARVRLLAAHRTALEEDGHAPDDDRLEDDLATALGRLADGRPGPPDPAALVAERAGRIRRRNLLVGGGAVALAGAAGWWTFGGALDGTGRTAGDGAAPSAASTAADSPVWATTTTWPRRGILSTDLGIDALVTRAAPGARLVFADDVDDVRVVVALAPDPDRPRLPVVRVWAGSVGAPAEQLVAVTYDPTTFPGILDLVALGVPHPTGATLLVLTRPGATDVAFSPIVHPTRAGSTERAYVAVPLENGVGHLHLDAPWGVAGRVRGEEYEGEVPTPVDWAYHPPSGRDLAASLARYVASATGFAVEDLEGRTVVDADTSGGVLDPDEQYSSSSGRITFATVRTPDEGLVRGLAVVDRTPRGSSVLSLPPSVVPADAAEQPAVVRLSGTPPDTGRFLVVVPGGGATVQLLATSPNAYPVSKVVPMRGETVVVSVVNADLAAAFRLVVKDADGESTYDAVPPAGRDLLDAEHALGWLGLPPDAST